MKKIIISSALLVAATVGGFAMANTTLPSPTNTQAESGMQKMKGDRAAVHTAIESNDFAAFQAAVKDTPLSVVDTAEEFSQLTAAHAAKKAGDDTLLQSFNKQLGLPEKGMKGEKGKKGKKHEKGMKNPAIKTAIESNDFVAFQTAAKDTPFAVVDTQEKFTKLVSAEQNMKAAHDAMKTVHTELGITFPEKK